MKGNNPNIFDANNVDQWLNDSLHGSLALPMSTLADAAFSAMFDQTKRVMGSMVDYKDLMMMYTCAMKEVQTKFEVLSSEL